MKNILLLSFLFGLSASNRAQRVNNFDIFTYFTPKGFTLKDNKAKLFYEISEGKNYCQLFLYPAVPGKNDIETDFKNHWDFFARNTSQGINNPETIERDSANGWQVILARAKGIYNKKTFTITLTTLTKGDITFYAAAVFSSQKYLPAVQDFIGSIEPDPEKFSSNKLNTQPDNQVENTIVTPGTNRIAKSTTHFDDGGIAVVMSEYVKVTKDGIELRLHYTDKGLDDARPTTIDAPEYYWSKYVEPYFSVSNVQKWSGVQYPVIYHMQANAVEKRTGKVCYVAIKIVYHGGARPIVVIAPTQTSYEKQFPHPNDIDPMLNANRFALTVNDIIGTWKGSGGGGVEYYNAYNGTYAGMSAVSSSDEFLFNSNGTYSSSYRSASMNNSGAQFGGHDFKGNFSVTDWSITATNRYGGKTITYNAQLIAVKNGYLLYMSDSENPSMNYTLFKQK